MTVLQFLGPKLFLKICWNPHATPSFFTSSPSGARIGSPLVHHFPKDLRSTHTTECGPQIMYPKKIPQNRFDPRFWTSIGHLNMQECPMKLNYYLSKMVRFSRVKKNELNHVETNSKTIWFSVCLQDVPKTTNELHRKRFPEDSHCPNLTLGKLGETQLNWFSIDMNLGTGGRLFECNKFFRALEQKIRKWGYWIFPWVLNQK